MRLISARLLSLLFITSPGFADANDYEIIGRYRTKTYNGLASKIAAELLEETNNKDRLFESMDIEFDVALGPIDGRLRYSRSVNVDNPEVEGQQLGMFDFSKYRVTNTIYTGLEGGLDSGVVSADGSLGVLFAVSKGVAPRNSTIFDKPKSTDTLEDLCRRTKYAFNPILAEDVRMSLKMEACGNRTEDSQEKNNNEDEEENYSFTEAIESFVKAINYPVRYLMQQHFVESEKMKIYSDQPFEALTNYSRFGFPVDLAVFYDKNKFLQVGDSIQHSSFVGWSPFNLGGDFGLLRSRINIVKRTRAVRDIRIRKEGNNKVTLQVSDYLAKGDDWQFLRVRPRILWLFKYSFVDWRNQDFDTMSFKRTYEIDLASSHMVNGRKVSGLDYLKIIVSRGWLVDLELDPDKLMEPEILPPGVKNTARVFVDGPIAHDRFLLRFPGLFELRSEDRAHVKIAKIANRKGSQVRAGYRAQAEGDREHSSRSKWTAFDWLFFNKTDRSSKCSLNTRSYLDNSMLQNSENIASDRLALNIDCTHWERYPDKKWPLLAWDTAIVMSDTKVDPAFRESLKGIDVSKSGRLSFVSNVSFNAEHMSKILSNLDEDALVLELAEIYLGPEYRKLWERAGLETVRKYFRTMSRHVVLDKPKMIHFAPLYCRITDGLASPKTGFKDFWLRTRYGGDRRGGTCKSLVQKVIFRLAKQLAKIGEIDSSNYDSKIEFVRARLESVVKTYRQRGVTFALSILLQRLAHTDGNPIHHTYSVDSDQFLEPIIYSSGKPFHVAHEDLQDQIPDAQSFKDTNNRIRNILVMKKQGRERPTSLRLDFFTSHKFDPESILEVEIRQFRPILKDKSRSKIDRDLTKPISIETYKLPLHSAKTLSKTMNGARFAYAGLRIPVASNWEADKTHVMYLRVKNTNQEWISEEAVVQFHYK